MDQRTPTARLASGKRTPHRFGYLFPTNSRMDHQQYGILPIWHHAQMTSSPPKPRAKKTPNTTRQPPNSACVTGSNPQRWLTSPRHHSEKAGTTAITPCMRGVRALIKLLFSSRRRCCWSSRALLRERRGLAGAKRKRKGRRTWRDVAFSSFLSKMSSSGFWRLRGSDAATDSTRTPPQRLPPHDHHHHPP